MQLYQEKSPIDGQALLQFVALLQASANATTFANFSRGYPGHFDPVSDVYFFVPGGAVQPRTTIVIDGARKNLLVLLNGMENFDKVPACIAGWQDPYHASVDGSLYPFETAANLIAPGINAFCNQGTLDSCIIAGHSYGGAVAPWLAAKLTQVRPTTDLKLYTFGAPKNTEVGTFRNDIVDATRRLMIGGDPVPCLPLGTGNASNIWALQGVPTARQWARWKHHSTGLLFGTGFTVPLQADYPPYADSWTLVFSFGGWCTGSNAFGNVNHSLDAYYRQMVNVPDAPRVTAAPVTGRGHTPAPPMSTVALVEQRIVAQQQMGNVVINDPSEAAKQIAANVKTVRGVRYRGLQISGVQTVLYGDDVVTVVPTRRARRALVRRLNLTL